MCVQELEYTAAWGENMIFRDLVLSSKQNYKALHIGASYLFYFFFLISKLGHQYISYHFSNKEEGQVK